MSVLFLSIIIITYSHITGAQHEISPDNRFVVSAVIRHIFELFRNVVKTGDYEKGVPIMDPYKLDHASFSASGKNLCAAMNFTNGVFTGLGDFELDSFKFTKSNLSLEFHLALPLISLLTEYYSVEGKLLEALPISAAGFAQIEIYNTMITGKLYLKQSDDGKSILLSHFENMEFTIDEIESNTQFNDNIDGLINAMVNDLLAGYLSRFSKLICATYGSAVARALNSILNKYETWHVIAVIL